MIKKYTVNTNKAISETLDNETIIINMETGNYYSMNPVATIVWNTLLAGKSITVNNASLDQFLQTLEQEGLIQAVDEPIQETPIVIDGEPAFEKYEDMQEMLLADPIHDVEDMGWPKLKQD